MILYHLGKKMIKEKEAQQIIKKKEIMKMKK
jgi:hypothetical protein